MMDQRASFEIDLDKLYALMTPSVAVSAGSGQPNPDDPPRPGPWDPVIRVAVKDMARYGPLPDPWRYGPSPEPWRFDLFSDPIHDPILSYGLIGLIARRYPEIWDVIGGRLRNGEEVALNPQPLPPIGRFGDEVALNPQPLPPRERFVVALGEALVARAEQLAEVAVALEKGGRGSDEDRGTGAVGSYVMELVDDWCLTGYRPHWPFPGPPPWWFRLEVSPRDILTLGSTLHSAGRHAFDPILRRAFGDGAGKLAKVGLERM